jgi:hypothetical protein
MLLSCLRFRLYACSKNFAVTGLASERWTTFKNGQCTNLSYLNPQKDRLNAQ